MKLDAKDAAIIARKYFEETKTHHYFLFETVKTSYNGKKEHWIVDCEVKDIFEVGSREYLVRVRDDGTISDVELKQAFDNYRTFVEFEQISFLSSQF